MDAQTLKVGPLLCGSPRSIVLPGLNCTPKSFLNCFPSGFCAEGLLGSGDEILIQLDRRSAHHAYILAKQYVHQAPALSRSTNFVQILSLATFICAVACALGRRSSVVVIYGEKGVLLLAQPARSSAAHSVRRHIVLD